MMIQNLMRQKLKDKETWKLIEKSKKGKEDLMNI